MYDDWKSTCAVLRVLRFARAGKAMHLTHERRFWIAYCLAEGYIEEPVRQEIGELLKLTSDGERELAVLESDSRCAAIPDVTS